MTAKKRKKKSWYYNLRGKYRFVVLNDRTFEERLTFRLNRLNVLVALLALVIILTSLTFLLIANTSLREYIPGYPDVDQKKEIYRLNQIADSLALKLDRNNRMLEGIKAILNDTVPLEDVSLDLVSEVNYDTITNRTSLEDSLFRMEFESQSLHNLYVDEEESRFETARSSIRSFNFFPPLQGIITSEVNPNEKHFGIDIVAPYNEAVKATLDGTVIMSAWTLETGYIMVIQHTRNLISVYKHNAVLLKHQGDYVLAGEPIAITGASGSLTTGPHLHFELWYNGSPIRPQDYILFN